MSSVRGAFGASCQPQPSYSSHHHSKQQLCGAVTSPALLSSPYPQQDILRLAGIQCPYSLRPQPVVQTWKLHHRGKMVLFHWKSTTLSKHSSAAKSYAEFTSTRNFSSSNKSHEDVSRCPIGCEASQEEIKPHEQYVSDCPGMSCLKV